MTQQTHYELMKDKLIGNVDRAYKFCEELARIGTEVWMSVPIVLGLVRHPKTGQIVAPPWGMQRTLHQGAWDGVTQQLALTKYLLDHQEDHYSYSRLIENVDFQKHWAFMAKQMRQNYGSRFHPGDLHTTLQLLHHMACHERAGKRVYEVTPELGNLLLQTELRGIKAEDMRLPYEAVYIQVPPGVDVKVWNKETGWHKAVGAYVVEENHMTEGDDRLDDAPRFRGWRLMLVGEPKKHRDLEADDALSFFRVLLKDGTNLEDVIKRSYLDIKRETSNPHSTWTEQMSTDWEDQFKWVMNVILYATWEEPGEHWEGNSELRKLWDRANKLPKGSSKRSKLKERAKGLPSQPRIRLGHKLVIRRYSGERKGDSESLEKSEQGSRILHIKTRVPGHWRAVAHGPKHSLRRQQWIQPYWRHRDADEGEQSPRHELR